MNKDYLMGFGAGKAAGGGGGGVTVESLSVTENGTYSASSGYAYNPVNVNVAFPPSISVQSLAVNSNGVYSASSGYAFDPVTVNVPNSYSAADAGKVVSGGALVPQTSSSVTENGTVDTTLINSLLVNVSGGGGASNVVTGTFTGTTAGVLNITLPYEGTGFPVAWYVTPIAPKSNGFESIVAQYGIETMSGTKIDTTSPYYVASGFNYDRNKAHVTSRYKSSSSAATDTNVDYGRNAYVFTTSQAGSDTFASVLRFYNSNKTMSVYIRDDTGRGFVKDVEYAYCVIYSE